MICFKCKNKVPEDSKFCQYCGADLTATKFCSNCGAELQLDMRFCPVCGTEYKAAKDAQQASECHAEINDKPVADKTFSDDKCNNEPIVPPSNQVSEEVIQSCAVCQDESPEVVQSPSVEHASLEAPKKKNKVLPIIAGLLIIALCIGGFLKWKQSQEKVDIAELADSVLYLEVYDDTNELIGTASGFLVNDKDTLVTNYHVVQDAYKIVAMSSDASLSADINYLIAYDEVADLAVLQCSTDLNADPLFLADSDTVKQGDTVYAVGYPLGLANTLSNGIVSSRYIDEYDNDILQVTAAISEGNSGGPLLNEDGFVAGVMCAYYVYGQNLNIAIASNTLQTLLDNPISPINLKYWVNRPTMPDQEVEEEIPETVETVPTPEPEPDKPLEMPDLTKPNEQSSTPPKAPNKPLEMPDVTKPSTPDSSQGNTPVTESPAKTYMNSKWSESEKAKVSSSFHGQWKMVASGSDSFDNTEPHTVDTLLCLDVNEGVAYVSYPVPEGQKQAVIALGYIEATDSQSNLFEETSATSYNNFTIGADGRLYREYYSATSNPNYTYFIYKKVSSSVVTSGVYQ